MTQTPPRGRKSSFLILKMNDSEKWGLFLRKAQRVKRKRKY
jgi:hypothetical protein